MMSQLCYKHHMTKPPFERLNLPDNCRDVTAERITRTNEELLQALQQAIQFHQQGRLDEAAQSYQAILTAQPDCFDAKHFLGLLRYQQGRNIEALENITTALKLQPNFAPALLNLGAVLRNLGRAAEALASYDRALAIKPDYAEALNNRGIALFDLKRLEEALASYDRALALKSDYAEALNNRGVALLELNRPAEALASYDRALALKRDGYAFGGIADCVNKTCDWSRRKAVAGQVTDHITSGKSVISPLVALSYLN